MSVDKLIKEYETELVILKQSFDKNVAYGMSNLANKRATQIELIKRFIKDLKNLFN